MSPAQPRRPPDGVPAPRADSARAAARAGLRIFTVLFRRRRSSIPPSASSGPPSSPSSRTPSPRTAVLRALLHRRRGRPSERVGDEPRGHGARADRGGPAGDARVRQPRQRRRDVRRADRHRPQPDAAALDLGGGASWSRSSSGSSTTRRCRGRYGLKYLWPHQHTTAMAMAEVLVVGPDEAMTPRRSLPGSTTT